MKKIIVIIGMFSILVFSGLGCKQTGGNYKARLEVWGTFDNSSAYNDLFQKYEEVNQNVDSVRYQKHTLESYKKDLLNALAAGTGPDIFMIHNSWLPDFQDKVVPMPEYMITEQEFRTNFVDVVADDMIVDGQMYGVPLSVDSLALYYNKDIFNAAGITRPPQTWDEFNKAVQTLTRVDEYGSFEQSAVSMGTAYNINRSADILAALMIQSGTEMSNRVNDTILFAEPVMDDVPGEYAFKYYTDFASEASGLYTWNKNQNYSIDEFYEGKTAMMINYSWHYDTIVAKNAKLNFAAADLPQISLDTVGDQANYANYWVMVVAKNKKPTQSNDPGNIAVTDEMRVHESWQLLKSLTFPTDKGVTITNYVSGESLVYTTEFDFTEKYLEITGKPAARRDLIEKQKNDVRLGAFARGNLIARSWWRKDAEAVDAIFAEMIDNVNTGAMSAHQAIGLGASRAQQLQE